MLTGNVEGSVDHVNRLQLTVGAPVVMRHAALRLPSQGRVPRVACQLKRNAPSRLTRRGPSLCACRRCRPSPAASSDRPLFPLTILRMWTKMAAAREFPAFAFLADRRMRRAVSAVSDGQQSRPQVLCGVWADACPHVSTVCLCQRARRLLLRRLWSGALALPPTPAPPTGARPGRLYAQTPGRQDSHRPQRPGRRA